MDILWLTKLESYLLLDDTKLIYILILILCANVLDYFLGWTKARFGEKDFSSSKASFGLGKKLILFMVLIYFIPFALLFTRKIGLTIVYGLYLSYLVTEISSILTHLGVDLDNKSNVFSVFSRSLIGEKQEGEDKNEQQ